MGLFWDSKDLLNYEHWHPKSESYKNLTNFYLFKLENILKQNYYKKLAGLHLVPMQWRKMFEFLEIKIQIQFSRHLDEMKAGEFFKIILL